MATKVLTEGEEVVSTAGSAVTIGVFDGVHRGHQWLLRRLRKLAGPDVPVVVVSFDPHPLQVLRPVAAPKMLTDVGQRLRMLDELGVADACLILTFDAARREQRAGEFIDQVLLDQLHAAHVMVGSDFRFGRDREGDVATLERAGRTAGFTTQAAPLLPVAAPLVNQPCSSTYIRRLVAQGRVDQAGLLLGRPHEVRGVVAGTSRPIGGRGTPVVVVRVLPTTALPVDGSYAGALLTADGRRWPAGLSIRQGVTAGAQPLVDVHAVGDLSSSIGHSVTLHFVRPLWVSDRDRLIAAVVSHADALGEASASGGWAAST